MHFSCVGIWLWVSVCWPYITSGYLRRRVEKSEGSLLPPIRSGRTCFNVQNVCRMRRWVFVPHQETLADTLKWNSALDPKCEIYFWEGLWCCYYEPDILYRFWRNSDSSRYSWEIRALCKKYMQKKLKSETWNAGLLFLGKWPAAWGLDSVILLTLSISANS